MTADLSVDLFLDKRDDPGDISPSEALSEPDRRGPQNPICRTRVCDAVRLVAGAGAGCSAGCTGPRGPAEGPGLAASCHHATLSRPTHTSLAWPSVLRKVENSGNSRNLLVMGAHFIGLRLCGGQAVGANGAREMGDSMKGRHRKAVTADGDSSFWLPGTSGGLVARTVSGMAPLPHLTLGLCLR